MRCSLVCEHTHPCVAANPPHDHPGFSSKLEYSAGVQGSANEDSCLGTGHVLLKNIHG